MRPVLDEIARERRGLLKVVTVDAQRESGLAAQFAVRGVPAFVLFSGGRRLGATAGALPKTALVGWIDELLRKTV